MITTGIDCSKSRKGTGLEPCQVEEGVSKGFILVPKGWQLEIATETFNRAFVDEQIQLGVFIPFVGVFNSTPTTPEPTTEESQTGQTAVVRQGLPTYVYVFKKGYAFHTSAFSYNSNAEYDFLIVYDNVIKGATTPDGLFVKGFDGGMLNTSGWAENTGAVSAQSTVTFQLLNSYEYNVLGVYLTQLDFSPTSIQGVVDLLLTGRADVSENAIYVKANWAGNPNYFVTGFSATNFRVNINGVQNTIVGPITYDPTTQEYKIVPTATLIISDSVVVQTYDTTVPSTVTKIGNKFYTGTTSAITPVA